MFLKVTWERFLEIGVVNRILRFLLESHVWFNLFNLFGEVGVCEIVVAFESIKLELMPSFVNVFFFDMIADNSKVFVEVHDADIIF